MKIEWAPLKIPPRRRFQTLVVALNVAVFMLLPAFSFTMIFVLIVFGNNWLKLLPLAYLAYMFYSNTQRWGSVDNIGWMFMRNNFLCRNFSDYFPIELVKTAELKPNRNYIIASFPHGMMGTAVFVNMGNNISKWLELYPGIRPKIGTLKTNFYAPLFREIIRLWGMVSVSKECLQYHLRKSNDPKHPDNRDGFTSNAVAILVGGAQEALDSHPGQYILTLKGRKGFVKLAIRTGSPIVPSFSFGEVDIYDQIDNPPDSGLRRFQTLIKKITGVSPILLKGRGFFQYTYGLLPQRKHIVQVLGAPIEVKKNDNPDPKYVDEIHQKVIDALNDLFETHKAKYIENAEKTKLVIH